MTAFSLGTIWEETIAFLRREGALLVPVALATFGVAQLLMEIGMGDKPVTSTSLQTLPPQALLVFPAVLLLVIGNLAVSRIALMPGRSIGESLLDALRCAPRAIAVMMLMFAIMMGIALLVVIAASFGAVTFRVTPKAIMPNVMLLLCIPMFIAGVRMMLLIPVLAVEPLGPIAAMRRTWELSRAHFFRFLGVIAIVLMLSILFGLVQLFVVGSLFKLLAYAISDGQLVRILQAVVNSALEAMLSLAVTLYIALIYRKVAAT